MARENSVQTISDQQLGYGFTYVQPQFAVSDLQKSIEYYTDVLGFEVVWIYKDADGNPDFANVCRDGLSVFLAQSDNPTRSVLNAHCDERRFLDGVFAEYQQKGANIVEPPSDRAWGQYEMRVLDLDGNVLCMQVRS